MAQQFTIQELRDTLQILRGGLESQVSAEAIGTASMIPLKAMVLREALLWRIVEVADAVLLCIDAGNSLGAVMLARAAIECVAVQNQLNDKIQNASEAGAAKLDDDIIRLLMGTRSFSSGDPDMDQKLQMPNVMTCLNRLDKQFPGCAKLYEYLCDFSHPNYAGTAGCFSNGDPQQGLIELGRYKQGTQQQMMDSAIQSAVLALLMFQVGYTEAVSHWGEFFRICDSPHQST